MRETHKQNGRKLFRPLVRLLAAARVPPNAVTISALPFSIASGLLFAVGQFIWAAVLLAATGLCDLLDGELSRMTGRVTRTGALLDSTIDRFCEVAVFTGIAWFYRENHWLVLLAIAAMVFSLMVSYVRARAEGLDYSCSVGWFERPVRMLVLLISALALGRGWMPVGLAIIALGSAITTVHRLVHVMSRQVPRR